MNASLHTNAQTSPQRFTDPYALRRRVVWLLLPLVLALVVFASLVTGDGDLADRSLRETLLELRAWRTATAFGVGASLAVAGVLVQGVFHNPLASPSILGTTAGASLGGQLALLGAQSLMGASVLASFGAEMFVPFGALVGALGGLGLLLLIVRMQDELLVTLLVGFLLNALFVSIGAFVLAAAQQQWELGRAVVAFTLGGVGGAGPRQVVLVATMSVVGLLVAWTWSPQLDMLQSGSDEAVALGVDVRSTRRWSIIWAAVLSAAAVAVGGNIAFVGLIVPHLLRPLVGPQSGQLVPASFVMGGIFVAACDVLARSLPTASEVPLGVVTGLLGAPLFLTLLMRLRREEVVHG